jgi:demethylsterigmatocystin 6-O-methyltransferase
MAEDSQILIDDMVPPNEGVNWQVTDIDMAMMGAGAAVERTVLQWKQPFDSVGLKIASRTVFNPALNETLTAVVPK